MIFRSIVIIIGLGMLGCAMTTRLSGDPPVLTQDHPPPHSQCPYASVYVAVSTDGSKRDKRIAEQVRTAFSDSLGEQGFSVAADPRDAYWSAFSMVGLSRRVESNFAWTVYMLARRDLHGKVQTPFDFVGEDEEVSELSGYMLLREIRLVDIEPQARRAAVDTADALLPHANRMCTVWSMKLEELRRELVKEMTRTRRQGGDTRRGLIEIEVPKEGRTPMPAGSGAEKP